MLDNGQLRQEQRKVETDAKFKFTAGRKNLANGPSREAKRKLAPSKQLDQAQVASPIYSLRDRKSTRLNSSH